MYLNTWLRDIQIICDTWGKDGGQPKYHMCLEKGIFCKMKNVTSNGPGTKRHTGKGGVQNSLNKCHTLFEWS